MRDGTGTRDPSSQDGSGSGSVRDAIRAISASRGRARQFWRVFDRSLVPMVIVGNDQSVTEANRAARLLLRTTLEDLRKRRLVDFAQPHLAERVGTAWSAMLADGTACGTVEILLPDRTRLEVDYCGIRNVLPAMHLAVFAPAAWADDELGTLEEQGITRSRGPLSPREREVLVLIAAGADLEQIAAELSISPATVRTHVHNAHRKLGARNRAHAIALAMQQGIIDSAE